MAPHVELSEVSSYIEDVYGLSLRDPPRPQSTTRQRSTSKKSKTRKSQSASHLPKAKDQPKSARQPNLLAPYPFPYNSRGEIMNTSRKPDRKWKEEELGRYKSEYKFSDEAYSFQINKRDYFSFLNKDGSNHWTGRSPTRRQNRDHLGPGCYKDNSKAVLPRSQSASITRYKPPSMIEVDEYKPGKYDNDKGFGSATKVNAIQPPRKEKKQEPLADNLDVEKARKAT